jgi:hypothetical protein
VNDVEEPRKVEGLSIEELEAQCIELLPDREEMQNIAVGFNAGTVFGNFVQAPTAISTGD